MAKKTALGQWACTSSEHRDPLMFLMSLSDENLAKVESGEKKKEHCPIIVAMEAVRPSGKK